MPEPDPEPPTTVAIVTLGCGRNEVDSQNAAGLLAAAGYRVVADPEQADAVVVNTCAFVEAAKRESIETVLDATALKDQGRARTVLVTGCLAERYTEELRVELPEADAIVPFADYGRLPSLLGGSPIPLAADPRPCSSRRGGGRCRWCSRPRRGRRSRPGRPPPGRWPWSSWPRAATGTARSAPSRRSGDGSAPGAPPRSSTRSPGWPARASPRSAWWPRTPPATARTWAAARP